MKVFQTVHDTWMISETTRLFGLTLTETGRITAPEGKLVTLVYNGENIPLLPGQYRLPFAIIPLLLRPFCPKD